MESLDQFRRLEVRGKARNVFVMSLRLSDNKVLHNIASVLIKFFSISLGFARFLINPNDCVIKKHRCQMSPSYVTFLHHLRDKNLVDGDKQFGRRRRKDILRSFHSSVPLNVWNLFTWRHRFKQILLAPIVQKVNTAIDWINHYPLDNSICFVSV